MKIFYLKSSNNLLTTSETSIPTLPLVAYYILFSQKIYLVIKHFFFNFSQKPKSQQNDIKCLRKVNKLEDSWDRVENKVQTFYAQK